METSRPALRRRLTALLGALVLVTSLLPVFAAPAGAAEPTLFFSEYIEGSSNNKALEIYNPLAVPVNLGASDVAVHMHFNGNPLATLSIPLTGTVQPGDVFVLAHASANATILAQADQTNSSGWFNGDDAITLTQFGGVIDSVGQVGFDPGTEWGSGLTSTADNTLRRKLGIVSGDTTANDAFDPAVEWDGFATDTFEGLGSHVVTPPDNEPVVANCGGALNAITGSSAARTVTATDPDGTVTSITLDSVTPVTEHITIGATTPAAGVGGTASATVNVDADTPVGAYTVTITAANNDATPQTATCSFTVTVHVIRTVGEVQGQTLDSEQGRADRSPFAPPSGNAVGQSVAVRGVVTQRIRTVTSAGVANYGFFLQDTLAAADGDPLTSDGIFVFHGAFTTLLVQNQPNSVTYFPEVGDQVVLFGPVSEFFFLSQLSNPRLVVEEIDEGVNVDTEVAVTTADPPDLLADAYRYWERLEGTRIAVEPGAVVNGGRDVFPSTRDGEVWVVNGDHPINQRSDPYARRVFRDPHPLDDVGPAGSFDNNNGMRFLLVSHGLKWIEASNETLIAPARTFDSVENGLTGSLYFTFNKYAVEVEQQLDLAEGADPSTNAPPVAHDDTSEYATAPYNVENLYDFRDDPFDGCDFTGNPGCPGVSPPFDYVPASEAAYEEHLDVLANQIVDDLHAPNILLIQEAEDQDICFVAAATLDCDDGVNNRDGRPDTLQELALAIAEAGGPPYDAAYDRNGADDRGIVAAFLYRTDRVELLDVEASHPVLGSAPAVDYRGAPLAYNADVQNPKTLNADLPGDVDLSTGVDGTNVFTRPPQVGYFRVWRDGIGRSVFTDLYAISNHFSSTPDARVGQRTEQAAYLAAIVDALGAAEDGERVTAGGDFNVFPRPDDPFNPGQACGTACVGPSDQLRALYDLGLDSLWEVVLTEAPPSAYSYVFDGQAQTLDNQFVTDALAAELNAVRYAHVNADWAADFDGDGSRGASDHDPQVARYDALPTIDRLRGLVDYFVEEGLISPSKVGLLHNRLDRAEAFYASGRTDAGDAQLVAFGTQAQDLVPKFADEVAADALQDEALLLIEVR
jgi:predicted extracellular nuclease